MSKNKVGRPKKKISKRQFEELCKIQCSQEEICAVLEVTDKTLTNWCMETYDCKFSEIFKQKRLGGRSSLRRMQYKTASSGNATMQIWLGKQFLNQKDKQEHTATVVNIYAEMSDEQLNKELAQYDEGSEDTQIGIDEGEEKKDS